MKKRLRKKLHLGEFKELGFELSGRFVESVTHDDVMSFFDNLASFCEDHKVIIGGAFSKETFNCFLSPAKGRTITLDVKEKIVEFLNLNGLIDSFETGDLRDSWYGWKRDFKNGR